MDKKDITFFGEAVALVASILGFVMMLIVLLLFGEVGILAFLTDYGSIVGALIAIGVAYFTIKKQTKNVRAQIDNQQRIANSNRFLDKKQELILAMGECRKTVITLADDYESNLYTLSNEKIYKYNESLAEKLNLCIFLMIEYKFVSDSEHISYSNFIDIISNLCSVNDKTANNHIEFLHKISLEKSHESFTSTHSIIVSYDQDKSKLEEKYMEIKKISLADLNEEKNRFLITTYGKGKYRFRDGKVWELDAKYVNSQDPFYMSSSYVYSIKKLDGYYWFIYKIVAQFILVDSFMSFNEKLLKKVYGSKLL